MWYASSMSGMMSLDDLRLFVAVAHERSFASAARRAGVPTSTLSRRIAALEDALGVRLLHRTSRSVGLTGDGERLLARAGGTLDELIAALDRTATATPSRRSAQDHRAGAHRLDADRADPVRIRRGAPARHCRARPVQRDRSLIEDGYDLAIRVGPIRDRELIARRLWTVPQQFLASPAFVRDRLGGRTRLTATSSRRNP